GVERPVADYAGVIANVERLRRIKKGELRADRTLAELEKRLREHRSTRIDLLVDLGVISDLEGSHIEEDHGADAHVPADMNGPASQDRGESYSSLVADLNVLRDDYGVRSDTD